MCALVASDGAATGAVAATGSATGALAAQENPCDGEERIHHQCYGSTAKSNNSIKEEDHMIVYCICYLRCAAARLGSNFE